MIKRFSGICALAVALAVVLAPVAKADGSDSFTYTSDGNTFVWQLPSSPTPSSFDDGPPPFPPMSFTLASVSFSENGAAPVDGTFDFYTSADGGGFDLFVGDNPFLVDAFGPPVFTGPLAKPTFTLGTFSFTDFATNGDGAPGTLTISGAVPEPSTIGLLAFGFLGIALGFSFKKVGVIRTQS
jgi:PEP-CTERM motif